ncbi:MAG: hypothetical protein MK108_03585 [Mariniblastus sp.]|nr:hypothetical protein [Mariniblastus sp.]
MKTDDLGIPFVGDSYINGSGARHAGRADVWPERHGAYRRPGCGLLDTSIHPRHHGISLLAFLKRL